MGLPSGNPRDPRKYEHLAKVDASGVVVSMVELAEGSGWESWTDGAGHRYVYLTDLAPDKRNATVDVLGVQLLPPAPEPVTIQTQPLKTPRKRKAKRGRS